MSGVIALAPILIITLAGIIVAVLSERSMRSRPRPMLWAAERFDQVQVRYSATQRVGDDTWPDGEPSWRWPAR